MISPYELRLGNWVYRADAGQYQKLENVAELNSSSQAYLPIPMNADTLKAFGFNFHDYFKLWQRNKPGDGKGPEMELDIDFWVLDFSHRRIGVEIKSLHQLQNLYFFLKGKELQPSQQWPVA